MTEAAAGEEHDSLAIMQDCITANPSILHVFAACTLIVRELLVASGPALIANPHDPMAQAVQELADAHNLTFVRKPTDAEISDPDWWGHAAGITADDEQVCEDSPVLSEAYDIIVTAFGELEIVDDIDADEAKQPEAVA